MFTLFSRYQIAFLFCVIWLIVGNLCQSQESGGDGTSKPSNATLVERGAIIYQASCANCHGSRGEGVAGAYPDPLIGDSSFGELTKLINDTMPEGEPDQCVGEDAEAVATYIYEQYYSPAAQVRNRPPRIGLARLTGNQLRQSLADLYAHFGGVADASDKRGVSASYFDGDRFKKENKKIERIDPVLQFDFGRDSPGEGIQKESFYILWEGSLKVDRTGWYEIVVRSTCSFKMDFGKSDRLFIDNHVQSGDKTEFRKSLMLTAGRLYPFKIDFIQRKRKTELPPASVSLSWVPPGGVEEIIPTRHLLPVSGPGTFALQSILPADDRSYGFERGIAINRQWDDSTTSAAIEFSQIATTELLPRFLRKHKEEPNENRAQLKAFLKEFLETAFRGPIEKELEQWYIDRQVDRTDDDAEAIKRVLLMSLKSPRFLYPLADSGRSDSQLAADRLSLVLFDSLPSDEWLVRLVRRNELKSPVQIREAAKRMVRDYRTQAKTQQLMQEWLNIAQFSEIAKDQTKFTGFDAALVSDLRASLDAFLDEVIWSPESDYRQFFKADWSFATPRMTEFYGDAWKTEGGQTSGLSRTVADNRSRHGLLTHPFMMSGLSYHDSTSPIHRGVFLIRYMLGRTLRPPSDAFSPLSPDLHPDLTTRERVALQTSPENCQVCHTKINGLGFVLENFDAVGRLRETERNKPIDPNGSYRSRADEIVAFQNAKELADYLADSPDAHRAFVSRAFQHFVKQPPDAYGPNVLNELVKRFGESNFSIRELIVEIAIIAATPPENATPPKEN